MRHYAGLLGRPPSRDSFLQPTDSFEPSREEFGTRDEEVRASREGFRASLKENWRCGEERKASREEIRSRGGGKRASRDGITLCSLSFCLCFHAMRREGREIVRCRRHFRRRGAPISS